MVLLLLHLVASLCLRLAPQSAHHLRLILLLLLHLGCALLLSQLNLLVTDALLLCDFVPVFNLSSTGDKRDTHPDTAKRGIKTQSIVRGQQYDSTDRQQFGTLRAYDLVPHVIFRPFHGIIHTEPPKLLITHRHWYLNNTWWCSDQRDADHCEECHQNVTVCCATLMC